MSRLLVLGALVGALLATAPSAGAAPGEYASPIFGVSSGKGGLLIADAGQGIVRMLGDDADLWAPLPGVTDVDPSDGRKVWAVTSGDDANKQVWKVTRRHRTPVADLFAFEEANNPHPAEVDSNPFDIEDLGDARAVVADAGGNDLILVRRDGTLKLIAVLPDEVVRTRNAKRLAGCPNPPDPQLRFVCRLPRRMPAEAVATSVVVRHDAFFVSELKGFPGPLRQSRIWRIDRDARDVDCADSPKCEVAVDGRTSIVDLAWHDGVLYAAQIDDRSFLAVETRQVTGGSVWACDPEAGTCEEVVSDQPILTAIALRPSGSIWGAVNALVPGLADVVRLRGPQ